jgi:DNA ligase-1
VGIGSIYQAGTRGWLWIKYKKDYKSEMIDTTDLVIIGAFYGRGKRTGTYGTLLLAAYNKVSDVFESVTKCGTGFTDEDLTKIPIILKKHLIPKKHSRVLSTINAEVWCEPKVVLEIIGAEITLSPIHTCGLNSIRKDRGLAIRFPRFTGKYRTEKDAEDATTSKEIINLYQSQLKQISDDEPNHKENKD